MARTDVGRRAGLQLGEGLEPAGRSIPASQLVVLRRTSEQGRAEILGRSFEVDHHWGHRLVRAEIDLTAGRIRFHALRHHDPTHQPILREHAYEPVIRRIWTRSEVVAPPAKLLPVTRR